MAFQYYRFVHSKAPLVAEHPVVGLAERALSMSAATIALLTPQEASDRLGVSLHTLYRMRGEGRIKWVQVTRRIWKVRESDLFDFIEANLRGGEDPAFSTMNTTGGRHAQPMRIVPFTKLKRR